jgi:hypothetical protein
VGKLIICWRCLNGYRVNVVADGIGNLRDARVASEVSEDRKIKPNNERPIPCPAARRGNCWFGMTKSGTPLLKFRCLPSWSYSCTFNMIQGDCRVSSQRENAQIQICIPLQKRGRAGGTGAAYLSAGAHQTEWLGNQRFHLDQRFRIRKRRFAGRSASLLMNHGNQ